jgi:hypothetical protein
MNCGKTVGFWLRGVHAPAGGRLGTIDDVQVAEFAKRFAFRENLAKNYLLQQVFEVRAESRGNRRESNEMQMVSISIRFLRSAGQWL